MAIEYRRAVEQDLPAISRFVDYWLAGQGKIDKVPGATHDYFVRFGQHASYLRRYDVMLACCEGQIVGWSVKTNKGVLIRLLVAATFRGMGIGSEMLRRQDPKIIRSKFDQQSGDPAPFYLQHGYKRASPVRVGRKHNIELFCRADVDSDSFSFGHAEANDSKKASANSICQSGRFHRRTIDSIAKKVGLGIFPRQ